MKLLILSDLHLEFGELDNYTPPECDMVVLAGDICSGLYGVMWAKETFSVPVIEICGNHEFWGQPPMPEHLAALKADAEGSNVHVLENESIVIGGVRFLCATLWTDYNLYGDPYTAMFRARASKDHDGRIRKNKTNVFMPEDALKTHKTSLAYLSEQLFTSFSGKTVVVSHHAPSSLSIHKNFERDADNPFYASRLENLILDTNPELYVHGHTHTNFNYMLGDTRILCNPRGYKNANLNPDFDPNFVIEI